VNEVNEDMSLKRREQAEGFLESYVETETWHRQRVWVF